MKEKNIFVIKTIKLLAIILLYYIVGPKSLFLYVLSLSLYKIFSSFFENIVFGERLDEIDNKHYKYKLYNATIITIIIIGIVFLIFGIVISNAINILLNIDSTLLIFILMGISVMTLPVVRVMVDYYNNFYKSKRYKKIIDIYYGFEVVIFLIIAIFVFRILNVSENMAIALLYLAKIISGFLMIFFMHWINKKKNKNYVDNFEVNYYKELKRIFTTNNYKTIINIVKNSYYYISIIVLYLVLSSRYGYVYQDIDKIITFVYFYALGIIDYLIYIIKDITKNLPGKITFVNRIYNNFKIMLSVVVFLGIISPLTCRIIFNNASYAIYLTMVNIMAIFILLFDITYENLKNKKIIYGSLIVGIISKVILIIPLINSFYRMGYNLVYGDILSSIIGMILSIIIGYIYITNTILDKEKYLGRILNILFDNIVFCIVLVLVQFVIPMNTDNYFKTLGLLWLYLLCIYVAIKIKSIKIRRKKR